MKKISSNKIERAVFAVVGILLIAVLLLSAMADNTVSRSRQGGDYTRLENVSFEKIKKEDAPTGIINECRFTLTEIDHAETLAFFINHHNVEVYLGGECVYTLTASAGAVRTPGGYCPMIPLYEDDIGKEVRVVLIPLYSDYQDEIPDFLQGSELAIYKAYFYQALPEMILSLCVVLAGVFLLCLAVYSSIKRTTVLRLYATGLLAVSAGLWRFTYGKFAYLLLENHTVFVYNLSVIALMLVALSMINSVKFAENRTGSKVVGYCSIAYCAAYIVQLLLQVAGILDLRQMLKNIHVTIIISAAVLCFSGVYTWSRHSRGAGDRDFSWLLGAGAVVDMLLYYFSETSVGMLFVLSAILCYSMLEGIRLLVSYAHQKTALEKMETQLTLSRTMTMMSQIRSHFVFNVLNAISGMCKYDPERADNTIVRFARYLRKNIDIMENDKPIPFATDLRQLEDYVILEQVRFGDKLEFFTDIEYEQFMIPPLILQPLVENAIKHGLGKKQGNGTIILRTREEGENIVITVEDDGVGFDMKELDKDKSVGLKNIRFRLWHLVHGTLDMESEIGRGTKATIIIPKKEAEKCE